MTAKLEKDKHKQDKYQFILGELLKDEENKYCADCDAKGPRWASWNLGVFLCIRCAGIHRNLGCHVSRIKSINLDSWNAEQLQLLREIGNSRARAIYEASVPDAFRRPQTDSTLETFIRAKYESKKYLAKEWIPPTTHQIKNKARELDEMIDREIVRDKKKRYHQQQQQHPGHFSASSIASTSTVNQLQEIESKNSLMTNFNSSKSAGNLVNPLMTDLTFINAPTTKTTTSAHSTNNTQNHHDLQDIFGSFKSTNYPPSNQNMAFTLEEHSLPSSQNANQNINSKAIEDLYSIDKLESNNNVSSAHLLYDIFSNVSITTSNQQAPELGVNQTTKEAILALYPKNETQAAQPLPLLTNQLFTPQNSSLNLLNGLYANNNNNNHAITNKFDAKSGAVYHEYQSNQVPQQQRINFATATNQPIIPQEDYLKKVQNQLASMGLRQNQLENLASSAKLSNTINDNVINCTSLSSTNGHQHSSILTADFLL